MEIKAVKIETRENVQGSSQNKNCTPIIHSATISKEIYFSSVYDISATV